MQKERGGKGRMKQKRRERRKRERCGGGERRRSRTERLRMEALALAGRMCDEGGASEIRRRTMARKANGRHGKNRRARAI
jgi:hypothetical protein